jgi:hypothetical protein
MRARGVLGCDRCRRIKLANMRSFRSNAGKPDADNEAEEMLASLDRKEIQPCAEPTSEPQTKKARHH